MKAVASMIAGLLVGLTGCAVGPDYRVPKSDVPPQFAAKAAMNSTAPEAKSAPDLATWWRALDDPELDSLVERAVKSNPDVEIALTRLQQARTYEAVVVGHALPEVDATAAAGRGTGSDLTRARADQGLRSADNSAGLQHINTIAGFDAVWELDIFGKYRREFEAARYDRQAAAAARYAVVTSVIADVVRAYVDLRGLQNQAGILHNAGDVLRESLRIVTIRYERGITNELDVALATRELDSLRAQIAPLDAQVRAAQYTLAVLLGEYPENVARELAAPNLIPSMPAAVAAGAPLDLLKRRPGHPAGRTRARGGHRAHRRRRRGSLSTGGAGRSDRVAGTGLGNLSGRIQAYLVIRSGHRLAAAGFRRAGCGSRYRAAGGARQPGELPQNHLERRAGSGYGCRWVRR